MEYISKEYITPYLSLLLATKVESNKATNIHSLITNLIRNLANEENQITFSSTETHEIGIIGSATITGYKVVKEPSWISNKNLFNIEHHVFISFEVGNYYALYFSESGKKDEIRGYFGSKNLPNIKVVNINQLNYNFINEDKIKMIWLSGIHGKNNFKADSKVLGGDSVADVLDPLLDQSYMMSAVRTQIESEKSTYGLNTFKSSIWRGPCKDWQTFENRVIEILDVLNQHPEENECPISILSYPITDYADLQTPYDFSLIDYEFLQENEGQRRSSLLKKLQYDYSASICDQVFGSSQSIKIDIFHSSKNIGTIEIEPIVTDYQVTFNILNSLPIDKKLFSDYIKVFEYPELIKCWYESGHAIVNGMIFKTGYRDVDYSDFIWTYFDSVDLTKEKPGSDKRRPQLNQIGNEDSLFCWVKNNWNGNWIQPNEFELTDRQEGWLYCDDGAGEKADFIHAVKHKEHTLISLIHVKAAKSNSSKRKVSVGVHDIVLNQAIKNVKYCTRKDLHEALDERIAISHKKYCWKDGKAAEASKFLDYLNSIKNNKYTKSRVIVIQPHTQKSIYENAKGSNIRNQLDVLLISAENAIHSTGANFHIFGIHD